MKTKSNPFLFTTAFSMAMLSGTALGQTYSWDGATDSSFITSGNWDVVGVPTTGGTSAIRINVNNGANNPLTYTSAQGHTISNISGDRSLVIAGTGNGAMIITGGTFESQSPGADVIGNGATKTGSLTINGGNYIKTTGTGEASTFMIGLGSTSDNTVTSNLTVTSGSFSATTLNFGGNGNINGSVVGTLNLNGGVLTTGQIKEGVVSANSITSTFNFNGGTLRALESRTDFINANLTNTVVQSLGAIIDSNGFNIGIAKALTAGTGSGGLTKQGAGILTLGGANTYTGATVVKAGTLKIISATSLSESSSIVAGDTGSSGAVLDVTAAGLTVGNGKTLAGIGTVDATGQTVSVSSGGKLAAGDGGVGNLTITGGSLSMASGSIFDWDIKASKDADGIDGDDGMAGTDFDSVTGTSAKSANAGSIFNVVLGGDALTDIQIGSNAFWNTPSATQVWNMSALFSNFSGAFTQVQTSTDVAARGAFTINGTNLTWTAVPEPTSALSGLLIGAGLLRRRRKS